MPAQSEPSIPQGPWNERYSQDLIENLPVGIYICNQDAVVVAYNRKAAQIWGETPVRGDPQIKFCGAHKLFTGDGQYLPHDQTPMVQVLATGKPILDIDVIVERRDGSRVNVVANITPLFDEAGVQIGFSNCVQDVTFQRQREEERLRLMSEHFQAQKMQTVGQLTTGIAHDFNNMLTSVTGSISLAEHYLKNEKFDHVSKYVGNALHGAKNAGAMIARLMAFSRRHELKSETVHINPLIISLVGLSMGSLGAAIKVQTLLGDDLPPVQIDPHQLESALLNLLVNARDAMPAGGKVELITSHFTVDELIASKSTALIEGQRCVRIDIADSGTGMPPELVEHIFEPFFTTKAEGKGTGLGLAMVYGYVLQAGGCLTVESEVGKGSRFSLFIPALPALKREL